MSDYVYQPFPKMIYKRGGGHCIVNTPDELEEKLNHPTEFWTQGRHGVFKPKREAKVKAEKVAAPEPRKVNAVVTEPASSETESELPIVSGEAPEPPTPFSPPPPRRRRATTRTSK